MNQKTARTLILALSAVGVAVSAYLLANSVREGVKLVCPDTGFINCEKVTTSVYSHIFGVPVALLGLLWFVAVAGTATILRSELYSQILPPLWIMGAVFVGYLVFSELFLIHAICVYCTVVHITALLIGIPVFKLSFSGE